MSFLVFQRRASIHISGLRYLIKNSVQTKFQSQLSAQILAIEQAFQSLQEAHLIPHAIFCEPISSREDAERLLRYLCENKLSFHPDDDPALLAEPKFTADEACELRHRMLEIDNIPALDPCEYYLELQNCFA